MSQQVPLVSHVSHSFDQSRADLEQKTKSFAKDFKAFILKGNVFDLAVAVVSWQQKRPEKKKKKRTEILASVACAAIANDFDFRSSALRFKPSSTASPQTFCSRRSACSLIGRSSTPTWCCAPRTTCPYRHCTRHRTWQRRAA